MQEAIHMLYTNEYLKFYMLGLDDSGEDAQEILKSIVEFELYTSVGSDLPHKLLLAPPTPHLLSRPRSRSSVYDSDLAVSLSEVLMRDVMETEQNFPKKYYGNSIVPVVSELPKAVRRRYAIPAIIRRIRRIMREDHKTLTEMELAGYLDLNDWKYAY